MSSNTRTTSFLTSAAEWDSGPEELIVLGEGEGAFWDNKSKSQWTQPERKQKRKNCALRSAMPCKVTGRRRGGRSLRRPGGGLRRNPFQRWNPLLADPSSEPFQR